MSGNEKKIIEYYAMVAAGLFACCERRIALLICILIL
jgi:hypothetical protein